MRPKRYPYSRNKCEKKTNISCSGDSKENRRVASFIISDKIVSNYIDASKIIVTI